MRAIEASAIERPCPADEQAVLGMSFERVCAPVRRRARPRSLRVELDGVRLAVVRTEGEVYAVEDVCSHADVAAVRGRGRRLRRPTIECWLHGSRFDLRTGEPTGLPATEPVPVYPVRVKVEDDDVDLPDARGLRQSTSN